MGEIKGKDVFDQSLFEESKKFNQAIESNINKVDELIKLMKKGEKDIGLAKSTKKVREENEKLAKANIKLSETTSQLGKDLALVREKQLLANKANKEAAKNALGLVSVFDKLNKKRREAQKLLEKNIILYGEQNKRTRAAQRNFDRLDKSVRKVNAATRNGRPDVGRYGLAFKNLASGLIGGFGVIEGLRLFVRIAGDAAKRVKEFDKEMVNLAAILGKNRDEVEGLEKAIIATAGASTKTSNEVAQLATNLIKLGNSEAEVKKLLKPVNDLSIALNATSEETAAFLGATLNAFGVGADEAEHFADVLSKAAVSSALDFQKLQESLAFVAPTAKQLGLTIEQTTARLSVLVDNGIKASRSGRLLNSSFARLIKNGKTLDGALEEINGSTDKVKTATELFGAEAFTIGLILADNTGKVDSLTKAYEDSAGSLKELTDKQMQSLEARLLILDSAYEKVILQFENGNGVLATAAKLFVDLTTSLLDVVSGIQEVTSSDLLSFGQKFVFTINELIPGMRALDNATLGFGNTLEKILGTADNFEAQIVEKFGTEAIINDLTRFESLLSIRLNAMGVDLDDAQNAAFEWQKGFREAFKAAEEVPKILEPTFTKLQLFAQSLANDTLFILEERTKSLTDEQNKLKVAFDKTGDEKIQKNLLEIAAKLAIVANAAKTASKFTNDFVEGLEEVDKKGITDFDKPEIPGSPDDLQKGVDAANKRTVESTKAAQKERTKIDKEEQELRDEIISNSVNTASEIFSGFTDLRIQQLAQESEALEFERNRQLEAAGDNERSKFEINEEFDRKQAEVRKKQANAEKADALFKIAIGTAVNIIKSGGNPVLIALAAALGAAQAAFVLAQPVPEFDQGTESTPADYIAGDKGSELRKSKGKWSLVNKPTLFTGSSGDKVVSTKQTSDILGMMQDMDSTNILANPGMMLSLLNGNMNQPTDNYKIEKKLDDVVSAVKNQPRNNFNIVGHIANRTELMPNGSRTTYINKYFKGRA